MGGVVLLKFLGELGKRDPLGAAKLGIVAACTVSSPVDVVRVSRSFGGMASPDPDDGPSWMRRGVNFVMTIPLKVQLIAQWTWLRSTAVRQKTSVARLLLATSLREVEEAIVCPLHGYQSPDDYYEAGSPLPVLSYISVPVLVLSALDDPLVYSSLEGATASREAIRGQYGESAGNPNIIMAESQKVTNTNPVQTPVPSATANSCW
jgi:predicted alpha/beta-fold hydrolase